MANLRGSRIYLVRIVWLRGSIHLTNWQRSLFPWC